MSFKIRPRATESNLTQNAGGTREANFALPTFTGKKRTNETVVQILTYGPRKAVAEVSNHKEPIGKECEALMRKSIDVRLTRVAVQVAWQVN